MKRYETIVIAAPTVTDEDLNTIVSSLEQVIAAGGGTVLRTDRWGKRRLAYRVKRQEEGHYVMFFYEAPSALVVEVERRVRIDERLIRCMTVLVDWEKKVAEAEIERAKRGRGRPRAEEEGETEIPLEGEGDGVGAGEDEATRFM